LNLITANPVNQLPATMHVLERGWLSSNNIVFCGQHETAVLDTGYVTHAAQTLALVQQVLQGRTLDRVLNTHLHSDHCGGNASLQAHYACRTTIPFAEREKVLQWNQDALSYRATGQQCPQFSFTDTLQPGDYLTLGDLEWQALAAPGHDPHSLVFYCASEKVLISADALWEHGFGVIFPELEGESGFAQARASIDFMAKLDVRLVIPGHGPMFAGFGAALARAWARLDFFEADPQRHAQYAIKVMLKFLLLEHQRIALPALPEMMANLLIVSNANQRFFQQTPQQLAEAAVAQLVRAGAARVNDDWLVNCDSF
jgi:glyoxylase-like metal-dependent hydrolase (beta-lactamase superfamily II)